MTLTKKETQAISKSIWMSDDVLAESLNTAMSHGYLKIAAIYQDEINYRAKKQVA